MKSAAAQKRPRAAQETSPGFATTIIMVDVQEIARASTAAAQQRHLEYIEKHKALNEERKNVELALQVAKREAKRVDYEARELDAAGKEYDEKGMLRGRLVNGKVVLENLAPYDAKLINDHLEWSATHRMWARRTASSICSSLTCST